jgi:hypothetical protein
VRESAGNRRCCCCPCGRTAFRRAGFEPARRRSTLPRSNRHLHHRLADTCAPAIEKTRWGTGDIGFSEVNSGSPLRESRSRGACCLCEAASSVRDIKGGRTRSCERSIRNLHHQRWLSRRKRQTKTTKLILPRRSERRAACCEPFKVRPAIGIRLIASFPPTGPARLGRARFRASPGIRVSRSGFHRDNSKRAVPSENKKPSGAAGSGGSV